eukprot:EG_transcript_7294
MEVVELPVVWRAAVAARDFEIGEEIIREPPLMLFPKLRSNTPLFDKLDAIALRNHLAEKVVYPLIYYSQASPEIKAKVHEFYVPRLPEDSVQLQRYSGAVREVLELEEFRRRDVTAEKMIDFLLILRCNVHMIGDGTKTSALFYLGSKVTHSCDPNCMALAHGIQLAYRAIRPIKKGEPITFSYISGWDLWKSTPARRALLQDQRFFQCCCLRCVSVDQCRRMICPACGDPSLLHHQTGQLSYMGQDPNPPTDTPWTCHNPDCGRKFGDDALPLALEAQLQGEILDTFFSAASHEALPLAPEVPQQYLKVCEERLGRHHWLTALMVYTHLALHHTALNKGEKPWSTGKNALTWADRLVRWMDQAMSGTMQEAIIAKFAGQTAEVYGVNVLAAAWFTKAIPTLRVHHGNQSKDILEMLEFVQAHGTPEQIAIASKPCAAPATTTVVTVKAVPAETRPTTNGKAAAAPPAPETLDPAAVKKQAKREKVKEQRRQRKQHATAS